MKERLLFIYNPSAGKAKIKNKLSDIVVEFANSGYEVIVMPTAKQGDAAEFAREYAGCGACDRIVCAGGDGTLNEVVTGVMRSGKQVPIGYIPAGTTNDFGYSLKIPKDTMKAAAIAAKAEPVPSDVGEICGRTFVYTAAFGLFSDVSYDTPQNMKNMFGRIAYLLRGVRSLTDVQTYNLDVTYEAVFTKNGLVKEKAEDARKVQDESAESMHVQGEFICGMVANSNSVGGFKGIMGKGVRFDDGVFEMLLIRKPHSLLGMMEIVNELTSKKLQSDNIVYAHVNGVRVLSQGELPWSLDGEFGGSMPQAEIHIKKQAVNYVRGKVREEISDGTGKD